MPYRFYGSGIEKKGRRLNIEGLLADIAEVMENMKENGERATPEAVIALAVRNEGGKTDGSRGHEQKKSAEIA